MFLAAVFPVTRLARVKMYPRPQVLPFSTAISVTDVHCSGHLLGDGHVITLIFIAPALFFLIDHYVPPTTAVYVVASSSNSGDALIDPVVGDVTPAASNLLGILYFGTLYGLTGHLQVLAIYWCLSTCLCTQRRVLLLLLLPFFWSSSRPFLVTTTLQPRPRISLVDGMVPL